MNTVPLTTELEWNNQCIFSTSFFVKFVTVLCLKNCILRSLSRIATLVLDVTDCYRRTMVFMSVCWSQPQALQKKVEPIEVPFGPKEQSFRWGPNLAWRRGNKEVGASLGPLIFSNLFGRWQQQCTFSLSILQ